MTSPPFLFTSLHTDWKDILADEIAKEYIHTLNEDILSEYKTRTVYPTKEHLFTAFNICTPKNLSVVILGQDPYHQPNQAHGLAFSILGTKIPPSLKNIYKEIYTDTGKASETNGDLTAWAFQGVLLLNTVLTVEENKPNSHANKGWELFTDEVIRKINGLDKNIVFLLWGAKSEQKKDLIDNNNHLILTCSHPSPLSAYRDFFGCKHFSQTNVFLKKHNIKPIDW